MSRLESDGRPLSRQRLYVSPAVRKLALALPLLLVLLLSVAVLALASGPARLPFSTTVSILLDRVGIDTGVARSETARTIVEQVRLPRVLAAGLVGLALAMAGTTLQALFRNPLADPAVIGVSSGGALGAVIAIATNFQALHVLALPGAAFVGATGAGLLVFGIAAGGGRLSVPTLLLAGIAVGSFLVACISAVLTFTQDFDAVRQIIFWLAGGLDAASWTHVRIAGPLILGAALASLAFARDMNLLLLGEETAQGLGVRLGTSRAALLALTGLLTGVAVSISGAIGFVGLVVPHVLRLIVGPDHRVLLPASALAGAAFLILADILARVALPPAELRVGIITALVGAPFFVMLLHLNRRKLRTW